jgi:hypothetical protein
MTDQTLTINATQAAVLHAALDIAITETELVLARNSKQSKPYRAAVATLLAQYRAERVRLAAVFPELKGGV